MIRRAAVTALAALTLAACSTPAGPDAVPAPSPPARPEASSTAQPTMAARPSPREPQATSWGVSERDWRRAGRLVQSMDSAQQAGQVIVAAYPGLEPPVDLVRDLGLAGVILFSDNIPAGDPSALAAGIDRLQQADSRPYPLVVAVDQEGGPVARVGPPATQFPPAMALGAADDTGLATRAAAASGRELAAMGFTMVFAPVADVTTGPSDPTIGVRSPGGRPALVARVASAQVAGYRRSGVVPVLKHFPGHGSVPADSHVTLPVQTASPRTLATRDLLPFRQAVRAGAPAVMVAHIDVEAVDPGVPSSVSSPVVTGLLRRELGFEGLVVTDSLQMSAVADRYGTGDAAVAALAAGADLLLMPADARVARDAIVAAVQQGRIGADQLALAARRVVAVQLAQARSQPPALDVVGSASLLSRRVSSRAVVVVPGPQGRCRGPLVSRSVRVTGGDEQDRALFAAAARGAGVEVGEGGGPLVALLGTGDISADADVVVALDTPYGLGTSRASLASVALFGRTPQAFEALLAVLTGRASGTARLPVDVPGWDTSRACWHSG
jgi:beta-N-acetylhexosaminidase